DVTEIVLRKRRMGTTMRAHLYLLACSLAACSPQTDSANSLADDVEATEAAVLSDADGAVTAAFDATLDAPQVVGASGDSTLGQSSITFPPGSLAIDGSITIAEGTSLLSDAGIGDLGEDAAA